MKLHRNAALSWDGRRQLARRVIEDGWAIAAAAQAEMKPCVLARGLSSRPAGSSPKRTGSAGFQSRT
jgi:hypothetical protein